MREWAEFSWQDGEGDSGGGAIVLHGPLLVSSVGPLDRKLRAVNRPITSIDLSDAGQIDTVGAWIVWRLAEQHGAEITGAGDQASRLLEVVEGAQSSADIRPPHRGLPMRVLEDFGRFMVGLGHGTVRVIAFLGAIVLSFAGMIRHPRRIRGRAIVRQMELVGVASLPIVGLMSFLIGIVIAQQGAAQLSQFGAESLSVNLVGRLTLRELGVLMTAIMVAGRSGSAFAAQLGTMQLTEEIDAMRTIGVAPMEALIIPRIMASVLMMPLLGFYASVIAILGGAVISEVSLGVPAMSFLMRIREVVPVYDLYIGMIKAPVFGLIIGLAGCYQGMQVEGNAEEVGLRTTQAVVQAIFMVIVLDAFFAVFFSNLGWN